MIVFDNYSYDTALIGITTDNRAIYDYDLMVEWLMEHEGFEQMEAIEWIDYNTLGAYFGPETPIIMHRLE